MRNSNFNSTHSTISVFPIERSTLVQAGRPAPAEFFCDETLSFADLIRINAMSIDVARLRRTEKVSAEINYDK